MLSQPAHLVPADASIDRHRLDVACGRVCNGRVLAGSNRLGGQRRRRGRRRKAPCGSIGRRDAAASTTARRRSTTARASLAAACAAATACAADICAAAAACDERLLHVAAQPLLRSLLSRFELCLRALSRRLILFAARTRAPPGRAASASAIARLSERADAGGKRHPVIGTVATASKVRLWLVVVGGLSLPLQSIVLLHPAPLLALISRRVLLLPFVVATNFPHAEPAVAMHLTNLRILPQKLVSALNLDLDDVADLETLVPSRRQDFLGIAMRDTLVDSFFLVRDGRAAARTKPLLTSFTLLLDGLSFRTNLIFAKIIVGIRFVAIHARGVARGASGAVRRRRRSSGAAHRAAARSRRHDLLRREGLRRRPPTLDGRQTLPVGGSTSSP